MLSLLKNYSNLIFKLQVRPYIAEFVVGCYNNYEVFVMFYTISDGKLKKTEILSNNTIICVTQARQNPDHTGYFQIPKMLFESALKHHTTRFESHDGLDILCLPVIDFAHPNNLKQVITCFIQKEKLLIIADENKQLTAAFSYMLNNKIADLTVGKILCTLLSYLLENDTKYLETLEQNIISLEDEIIQNKHQKNYVGNIVAFRKELLALKRYYMQLQDVFESIYSNENNFFNRNALRLFKLLGGKVDRFYQSILHMQDSVTQIREAYQSEVDINLNTIMKIFTVITAVFLPLTLIAGWYGMNFNMPEYRSVWGYPIVIVVSAVVVITFLLFFKKRKWF